MDVVQQKTARTSVGHPIDGFLGVGERSSTPGTLPISVTRRRSHAYLAALLLVLFSACGPQEGVVVRKDHHPAQTYIMFIPICNTVGKATICTPLPYWIYDDEDWVIKVENDGKVGTITTSQRAWESVDIGEWFDGPVEKDKDVRRRK